jgi:Na+/H+-translocating membrane pyrophosphatase
MLASPYTLPLFLTVYYIFTSLMGTIRVLVLKKNVIKLALYRHFRNTLLFAIIGMLQITVAEILYCRNFILLEIKLIQTACY